MPPKGKTVLKEEVTGEALDSASSSSPWTGRTRGKRLPESLLHELTGQNEPEEEDYAAPEQEISEFDEP
uniref:Intraflagellar transport protein 43 homolog n=2 Tax=Bursaphelenchus xylophilus TaxID=6326 RepID=A0A1I7SBZ9_BURXY